MFTWGCVTRGCGRAATGGGRLRGWVGGRAGGGGRGGMRWGSIRRGGGGGGLWSPGGGRGGRARGETGDALQFEPAGRRLACFMIYGPGASTPDAGQTWVAWKTNHMDFGAVDWEGTGEALLGLRHESGGVLCFSADGGRTWKDL